MYARVPPTLAGCKRTVDNREACPPRMSDGRAFTDYRPRCASMVTSLAGTYGNEQTRNWLTSNAESLIANARQLSLHMNACSCTGETAIMANGDVVPEKTTTVCTADSCSVATVAPGGLGQGRRYTTDRTDTTGAYLSRIPGHMDLTFKSRGVIGLPASCATDDDLDVAWSGFAAGIPTPAQQLRGRH